MWHASVSLQDRRGLIDDAALVERAAVQALDGVGGDTEWWLYRRGVGHLRVPVTDSENAQIPPGLVTADAGETGPPRPRTTRQR